MEKINNKLTNINSINTNNKFSLYSCLKEKYNDFISHMEKSDFKNAYTRYLSERAILVSMLENAKKEHLEKETDEILKRLEEVNSELLKRGIKLP